MRAKSSYRDATPVTRPWSWELGLARRQPQVSSVRRHRRALSQAASGCGCDRALGPAEPLYSCSNAARGQTDWHAEAGRSCRCIVHAACSSARSAAVGRSVAVLFQKRRGRHCSRPTLCRRTGRGHAGDAAFRQLVLIRGALPCVGNVASVAAGRRARSLSRPDVSDAGSGGF